jgi:hypothetical protein
VEPVFSRFATGLIAERHLRGLQRRDTNRKAREPASRLTGVRRERRPSPPSHTVRPSCVSFTSTASANRAGTPHIASTCFASSEGERSSSFGRRDRF